MECATDGICHKWNKPPKVEHFEIPTNIIHLDSAAGLLKSLPGPMTLRINHSDFVLLNTFWWHYTNVLQ